MIPTRLQTPFLLGTALLTLATECAAQDLHPSRRPSPAGIARTFLGDTYVKVTYGRPYMRGRAVFGTPTEGSEFLVPFGRMWRTGANEATELTVSEPVMVEGQRLEAGTYSVFTVPGPSTWEVHVNRQVGMDGTGRLDPETGAFSETYDPVDDVLVVEVSSGTLAEDVDQLTIEFRPATPGSWADMVLMWERTEVTIRLTQANR
ncbi:MAG: DUF2911 domain-containing protein [Gemmatimonadota bacterium]|jgi:hypothetical protein